MAYFMNNLGVSTVIYSNDVATVFSIQGWKNHMDAFNNVS